MSPLALGNDRAGEGFPHPHSHQGVWRVMLITFFAASGEISSAGNAFADLDVLCFATPLDREVGQPTVISLAPS